MALLKQAMQSLSDEDREQLMLAHDHEISMYLRLSDGRFIGVHCADSPHLLIEEQSENGYYYGRIKYHGAA